MNHNLKLYESDIKFNMLVYILILTYGRSEKCSIMTAFTFICVQKCSLVVKLSFLVFIPFWYPGYYPWNHKKVNIKLFSFLYLRIKNKYDTHLMTEAVVMSHETYITSSYISRSSWGYLKQVHEQRCSIRSSYRSSHLVLLPSQPQLVICVGLDFFLLFCY